MDEYRKSNLQLWNNWAELHVGSATYDVESFKAGKNSLNSIELDELGDVRGKTLLHLQCHFGKDTMSWARLGAVVTGADFSDKAIEIARGLSAELDIPATFVLSDIYALPAVLSAQFDIVFTSYGAIYWLNDMDEWARIAAGYLKPGGVFYVAEFHPFLMVFDTTPDEQNLKITYPYSSPEPQRFETQGSYAAPAAGYTGVEYGWSHSMSDIINALIKAGLRIEFLHEHHLSVDGGSFKAMEPTGDGWFRLKDPVEQAAVPLMFSIRAHKPV
ncbi:MAG: class I SAM-dependent methyltransferase [Chloroflexota bacterium]|nr:class I SAM-dependent methyltransferase [Chloroflexota bacterium]